MLDKGRVDSPVARAEATLQWIWGEGGGLEFDKDGLLEEFGDVREEGNSKIVEWVSLVFFRVFRCWCTVTKLENCRDMASGDYGIEEVREEVACQRARVNDVLRVNSVWA